MFFTRTKTNRAQGGFTLVEIIVSTAIFITVVSSILILLTIVLRVNREVQANREITQGVRAFTEVLAREIRNGRIYYGTVGSNCSANNYLFDDNQTLALTTTNGDQLCFSLDANGLLNLEKVTGSGTFSEVINTDGLIIDPSTFRFIVLPQTDPEVQVAGSYPGIQPMVTILAEFSIAQGEFTPSIAYQTTISTDVYDIPHE